jgi:hypothetical protein
MVGYVGWRGMDWEMGFHETKWNETKWKGRWACLAYCLHGARAVLYADDDDDRTQGLLHAVARCCTLLGLLWPLRLIRMQHVHLRLQIEVQGVKTPDASVLDTLYARAAHDTPLVSCENKEGKGRRKEGEEDRQPALAS